MEYKVLPTNLTTLSNEYMGRNRSDIVWSITNKVSIISCSLILVVGTIGNGLVIFITGFRLKKTVHTVWILSLAIADFALSIFLLFNIVHVALQFHWPFGRIMCKVKDAIIFFNLFTSIYILVFISVDRCVVVWCPVWAQNRRTPRLASFVVVGVCILALVLCSPHLYFKETARGVKNTTSCSSIYPKIPNGGSIYHAIVLIRFIFGFAIPFCVILFCYGAIVVRLRRGQILKSNRPFKVITAVIVAFFICWVPFHIFHFLKVKFFYVQRRPLSVSIGLQLSYILADINSCLNPILYFFMGHNFKKKLRWSFLSTLMNAFIEESNQSSTNTNARSIAEMEMGGL